jgi:hypothetical protein
MESISKLETTVASWYKSMPHLSEAGRKWLAENVWWIALVGVILGVLGIWGILTILFFTSAVLTGFGGIAGAAVTGVLWIATFVGLLFSVLDLVLTGVAINPLKAQLKKGWTLLFVVLLINVASAVVGFLFKYNLIELIWSLLTSAAVGYFLFEIRSHFVAARTAKKVTVKKTA